MSLRREATPTVVAIDALIDDVLLRTLEPTIAALDRLFDAARPALDEDGEPDGFDGLDRRGSLDRLLPSEWLLAAEAPEEFIRRFEHRELGYLRLSTTIDRRPQTALVLFDTGPDQLGRPRLAQLATLVVLARRSAAVGAELRWGTLQQPGRHAAAGSDALGRFVAARTFQRPDELPLDAFVDDCLIVSPLAGPPHAARQLVLSDDGDSVTAQLVDRRSGRTRGALLPMPPAEDGVRLFRNPIATGRVEAGQHVERAPVSNLVFDDGGHKLLARIEPHRLAVYPVPNSPKDKPSRIRYVSTRPGDGVIAAAGRVKRSVITVNITNDGAMVVIRNFGGAVTGPTGTYPIQGGPVESPTPDAPLGRVRWVDGKLRIHLGPQRLTQVQGAYRVDRADQSFRRGRGGFDVSATPTDEGWVVRAGSDEWLYRDGPVFGVLSVSDWSGGRHESDVRILVLDAAGRSIVSLGRRGDGEILYRAGETILDAVAHEHAPTYALRTASGRVVIRSWIGDAALYEAFPK
jgi:hypothetical protein